MLSMKVKIKASKNELPDVKTKIKYNDNQPVEVTQIELTSLLIAYAKTVLKDYSLYATEEHLSHAVEMAMGELELQKEEAEAEENK